MAILPVPLLVAATTGVPEISRHRVIQNIRRKDERHIIINEFIYSCSFELLLSMLLIVGNAPLCHFFGDFKSKGIVAVQTQ